MKLYCDPLSTSCRSVLMLVHDFPVDVEIITINLHLEENRRPEFLAINPNGTLPVLEDDGFVLTESSAIMKYLSLRLDLSLYPKELAAQIRVDEMVSWFTTNLRTYHNILGTYPKMLASLAWLDPATRSDMAKLAAHGSDRYLRVLDRQLERTGPHVCGQDLSIADYVGIAVVTLAEFADFDFSPYPHVQAWIARMSDREGWDAAFAGFTGLVNAARRQRSEAAA